MESPIYRLEGVVQTRAEDLQDFIGPLDLILSLLSKNKMEIKDIQLSVILGQYLDWMNLRKKLDLEVASEFIAMASYLVDIKTRMLLSIHNDETDTEMELLKASLEAHEAQRNNERYKQIKGITGEMNLRYQLGQNYLVKGREVLQTEQEYKYEHAPRDLWKAMHAITLRLDGKAPVQIKAFEGIVGREPYPVAQKAMEVLSFLLQHGKTSFTQLLHNCTSRTELVATFIAILDLSKNNRLALTEDEQLEYIKQPEEGASP